MERAIGGAAVVAFGLAFGVALDALTRGAPRALTGRILERLGETGVTNPVTAVILNYRGYDTLVEIAVITVAGFAVTTLLRPTPLPWRSAAPDPVLSGLLRGLVPLALIFGGYLLWKGAKEPGGAFQGAAVVTGSLTLWHLAGELAPRTGARSRALALCGLAVFVAAAALLAVGAGAALEYPARLAGWIILGIETACLSSLAVVLFWVVAGFSTPDEGSPRGDRP